MIIKSFHTLMFAIMLLPVSAIAQDESSGLLKFEQSIDNAVVATDIPFLEKAYATDYRFKHGTGLVDTKASWLKAVGEAKGKFISRQIDSVEVEIHDKVGITNGRLTVKRHGDKGETGYIIKYVRVYIRKGKSWELISHRTVWQKNSL